MTPAAWVAETGKAQPQGLSGPQSEFKTSLGYPGNSRPFWAMEGKFFFSQKKRRKRAGENVQ